METQMERRVHCGVCGEFFKDDDTVFLDESNTMTHKGCYNLPSDLIKDIGTYKAIIEKHPFFHSLL